MIAIASWSSATDGCRRLIAKKAYDIYQKLTPENRRWIDVEDVIQEGLLEAVKAESRHDPNRSKFSSYLFRGLDLAYGDLYLKPQRSAKRRCAGLVEIDAPPVEGMDAGLDIPDDRQVVVDAAKGFVELVARLPSRAAFLLLRSFVGFGGPGKGMDPASGVYAEIRQAANALGYEPDAFRMVAKSMSARKKVACAVANDGRIELQGSAANAPFLECVSCRSRFGLQDVRDGKLIVETMTCRACYRDMLENPAYCFGNGYSEANVECRLHCLDRRECRKAFERGYEGEGMAKGKKSIQSELAAEIEGKYSDNELDELEDLEFEHEDEGAEVEEVAPKKVKKEAKAKPAAKKPEPVKAKAKVAKPEKKSEPVKADKKKVAPTKAAKAVKKAVKKAKVVTMHKPVKAAKPISGMSKSEAVLKLVSRANGATMAELVEATGWNAHSIRGLFSHTNAKTKMGIHSVTLKSGKRVFRTAA